LINVRPNWFREWATELFAVPAFPSAIISPEKKKKFLTDAMRCVLLLPFPLAAITHS
jgi:hypothetical protein